GILLYPLAVLVAEQQDQREHRERIQQDAERIAAVVIRRTPHATAADAGKDLPVEDERRRRHGHGLRPREIAEQEREAAGCDVRELSAHLAAREAHRPAAVGAASAAADGVSIVRS